MADTKPATVYDNAKHCGGLRRQPDETTGERLPCTRPLGWGTDHPGIGRCKLHGGASPTSNRAAQREMAAQELRKLVRLGEIEPQPEGLDPRDALAAELWRTNCTVAILGQLVSELELDHIHAPLYHVSGAPTGEAKPHVLVTMWQDERKHLTHVATSAAKAGVEARRVQLEQQRGELIAQLLRGIAADAELAFSLEVRRTFLQVAAKHLRSALNPGSV